jgi:hypothetical protein
MQWLYVEPEFTPMAWEHVAPGIRRGLARGCGDSMTEEWLLGRLLAGDIQLWARSEDDGSITGSIIIAVVERDKGKAIEVLMTTGDWWKEGVAMNKLREYAAEIGAYTVEAIVRNGVVGRLTAEGWRQKAVVMDLEV